MVEVQVSLSEQTLDDLGSASLGSARGIAGGISNRGAVETIHTSTISQCLPCSVREPLGQHGLVLGSPSKLGQVEVILQQPSASGAGRGILSVGGPRVSGSVASQSEGEEEGGGHCEGVPGSFTVSFGIPTEEASAAGEQDSDSEGDPDKPNKHRARHSSKYLWIFSICIMYHSLVCILFLYAFECVGISIESVLYANRSLNCICQQHLCNPKPDGPVCAHFNIGCLCQCT